MKSLSLESIFALETHRRLFFLVAFIIGHSQSQDKMCCRYLAYAYLPRICRACDVTAPEESDNPDHQCRFISMSNVHGLCLAAMQLYLPKECGIRTDVDYFTVEEIKETKLEAHKNLRMMQHMHIMPFMMSGLYLTPMAC